jgi:hypothetical protein
MYRFLFSLFLFNTGCGNSASVKTAEAEVKPPYFVYASRFNARMDKPNPFLEEKVVKFWKGYESANFLRFKDMFAPTIELVLPEGTFKGSSADMLKQMAKRIDHISTLQVHVLYWHSVFITDKNETWVFIWTALEGGSSSKPGNTSSNIHQVWRFDKSGKAYAIQEYQSPFHIN